VLKKAATTIDVSRRKAAFAEVVGISNPNFGSFLFLVFFLSSLGWMSDSVFVLVQSSLGNVNFPGWSYLLLGISPFFLVTSWGWLRWKSAKQHKVRLRAASKEVEPHEGVILFLSNIRNPAQIEKLKAGDPSVLEDAFFSWKMCQRGLEKHRDSLRNIWVICSHESAGQFQWFVSLFSTQFEHVEFIRVGGEDGLDFENMEEIVSAIEEVLHVLPHDMDESEVIIDITSGQKSNSVAGALVTLADPCREFQYVQTNEPYEVKTYAYHITTIGKKIRGYR